MHVTHELLERATPVCIPFRSPWGIYFRGKGGSQRKNEVFYLENRL